ncbi:MAG: FAD-binding oxidoreductase [Betaproteobacteria bacterium]|nr:FAD-binding oxidoreductase [Betaproteobacteria bacterium]
MSPHEARVAMLQQAIARADLAGATVGLRKPTSNLFRDRRKIDRHRLDVGAFNHVIAVRDDWVDTEGMVTYEALADATLPHGVMPAVVPQLKSTTIGGAVAGVGIEATSFRHGLVHASVLELDVLLPGGRVVYCTAENEHQDLLRGFPNSYGTLGYALRVRARTIPVKPYVKIVRERFTEPQAFFAAIERACASAADFVDGVVFSATEMFVNTACFTASAPATSDYTYENIFYRSIREKPLDYMTVRDYLWRWDTDWFWCSKNVFAEVPWLRKLYGRKRLNSRTYTKIMRWNAQLGLTQAIARLRGLHSESIIQDIDVPIAAAVAYLDFHLQEIDIRPIWICPIGVPPNSPDFDLYPMDHNQLYVNFGFWDVKRTKAPFPSGHFNRLIEHRVTALGGIKSLYSDSYFTSDEFAAAYGGRSYQQLKSKYDPDRRFGNLYDKCVLRH